jgi:hypothetical protein
MIHRPHFILKLIPNFIRIKKIMVCGVALFFCNNLYARITNFQETHFGLLNASGYYFYPSFNPGTWNPSPDLAPEGVLATGYAEVLQLPLKIGLFIDLKRVSFDLYGVYAMSLFPFWEVSGDYEGSLSSTLTSMGAGAALSIHPIKYNRFRAGISFQAEYILQSMTFSNLAESVEDLELLALSTTSMLAGAGPHIEVWIGDMWVLQIAGIMQFGTPYNWNVKTAGSFLGVDHAAGPLTSATTGEVVKATFGGFFLQAQMRLNFN